MLPVLVTVMDGLAKAAKQPLPYEKLTDPLKARRPKRELFFTLKLSRICEAVAIVVLERLLKVAAFVLEIARPELVTSPSEYLGIYLCR